MAEEKKEMTYEEELKALKAKWADRRAEERKIKKAEAKAEKKVASIECAKKALEVLKGIDHCFDRELAPVVNRLIMFINGEKFTRNAKGGND